MHPSSCFAARLKRPAKDPVPYSKEALRQDLLRVRNAWEDCQANRDRNAIYGYLSAVFDLVMWWKAENRVDQPCTLGAAAARVGLASYRRTICDGDLVHR